MGAPISTILIVFELTGSYEVTTVVMVAAAADNRRRSVLIAWIVGGAMLYMLLSNRYATGI